jgi:hypothetical protein
MGDNMNSQCECGPGSQPFTIFQGQDKTMSMRAAFAQTGLPLDLTDCTQIDVALPNADGTFTNLLLTDSQVAITTPALAGAFTVPITNEVSALLNVAERQNVDVAFTISGLVTIVRFWQALTVLETPV